MIDTPPRPGQERADDGPTPVAGAGDPPGKVPPTSTPAELVTASEETDAGKPDVERDGDTLETTRPTLLVQTVYFHPDDNKPADDLGRALYDTLTRPLDDELAAGAGVPVRVAVAPDRVDVRAARRVVIACVLGDDLAQDLAGRSRVSLAIERWRSESRSAKIVVLAAEKWRGVEDELAGAHARTFTAGGFAEIGAVDTVTCEVARSLADTAEAPTLYLSCARAGEASVDEVADAIDSYVRSHTAPRLFTRCRRTDPGTPGELTGHAGDNAVLLAVRNDRYSADAACQRELKTAKLRQLPTLSLLVLEKGEPRSVSYGGNTPTVVWKDDPRDVVVRALVEWIRARLFTLEAQRIHRMAQLPKPVVLSRAPELLDLTAPSQRNAAQVMIYPDPQLQLPERQLLASAHKRLHLITPTGVYRYLRRENTGKKKRAADEPESRPINTTGTPLDGLEIGLSVSRKGNPRDAGGLIEQHLEDAVCYVARCLIAAGAGIAYGGDFRRGGFDEMFIDLIDAYNQNASFRRKLLHSYIAALDPPIETGHTGVVNAYLLKNMPLAADEPSGDAPATLSVRIPPGQAGIPKPLYYSDMRRVMAASLSATVVIGGANAPLNDAKDNDGYGGLYPGVVEEAWRMLEAGKPLYVAGGFGGAAWLVAQLLEGAALADDQDESIEIPRGLDDAAWLGKPGYKDYAQRAGAICSQAAHMEALQLPDTMKGLTGLIHTRGRELLASRKSAVHWNGLTRRENRRLFRSTDPVEIAGLVLKGLRETGRGPGTSTLRIELVHGDVLGAAEVDALSVPVAGGNPIGAASNAVDKALGGRMAAEFNDRYTLIDADTESLAVDWIHLANLHTPTEKEDPPFDVAPAVQDAVARVKRHGFRRLGVVLYGDGSEELVEQQVAAMLDGFKDIADRAELVWYESDARRFTAIKEHIEKFSEADIRLTTRAGLTPAPETDRPPENAILMVDLCEKQARLTTTFVPPAGNGIASARVTSANAKFVDGLSIGVSHLGRKAASVPEKPDLEARGRLLAEALFGAKAHEFFVELGTAPLHITHNLAASKLPFEILRPDTDPPPAVRAGISRRLIVKRPRARQLFARPPKTGLMRVLLIVNPTDDPQLANAYDEGKEIAEYLGTMVDLKALTGESLADRETVMREIAEADILHYCGHAFFDGEGAENSGICLADGDLTLQDIRKLGAIPRMVFFNACEAGRIRADRSDMQRLAEYGSEATAFAEFFLRGGTQAYIGTHWFVRDLSAARFANEMYRNLIKGETLAKSVRLARALLYQESRNDWANYILYGTGEFRLF